MMNNSQITAEDINKYSQLSSSDRIKQSLSEITCIQSIIDNRIPESLKNISPFLEEAQNILRYLYIIGIYLFVI